MLTGAIVVIFSYWVITMTKWLGTIGSILAFILAPSIVIMPVIFLIVEGVFPVFYFKVLGVGILGFTILKLCEAGE